MLWLHVWTSAWSLPARAAPAVVSPQLLQLHGALVATAFAAAIAATWLATRRGKNRAMAGLAWILALIHPGLWTIEAHTAADQLESSLGFTGLTLGLVLITHLRPGTAPEPKS